MRTHLQEPGHDYAFRRARPGGAGRPKSTAFDAHFPRNSYNSSWLFTPFLGTFESLVIHLTHALLFSVTNIIAPTPPRHPYPLSAPTVIPFVKYCCRKAYTSIVGAIISTNPAKAMPQSLRY